MEKGMKAVAVKQSRAPVQLTQVVYALAIGGSESLAHRLVRSLREHGEYACSIYAVDRTGPLAAMLAADGIPCMAFARKGKLDLRVLVGLIAQFRSNKTRLVHTHHIGQLLYGGLAGRLAGARVVHTEHEFYSLARPRTQRLLRGLTTLADRVTAVAPAVTAFLRETVGVAQDKLETITNGVPLDLFRSARPIDRADLGCGDDDVVIGCVARLSPEKGQAVLLQAVQLLRAKYPQVRLLLIGEGEDRTRLRRLADQLGLDGAVRFLGMRSDVPELMASCDLVALPSLQEGSPLALVEALAAGKAVVATETGAVPELIQHGHTGLLVPPGNPRVLSAALGYVIDDREMRRKLGSQGVQMVERHFDFRVTAGRYREVYESVLAGRNC
jgi:glycosyltransferase involved in cell wall biosynthesis